MEDRCETRDCLLMTRQSRRLDQLQAFFNGFPWCLDRANIRVSLEDDFANGKVGLGLGYLCLTCKGHSVRITTTFERRYDLFVQISWILRRRSTHLDGIR